MIEFALESSTLRFEFGCERFVRKDFFDGGLGVVEIAADSRNVYVIALLRHHLKFLQFAYAFDRIEYDNVGTHNARKPFERGFARIAACCDQNKRFFGFADRFLAAGEKVRQKRERDVFERVSRTVPEFENTEVFFEHYEGRGIAVKAGVRLFRVLVKIAGEFGKIFADNERRTLVVTHIPHLVEIGFRYFGEGGGYEKSALFRESFHYGLRAADFEF